MYQFIVLALAGTNPDEYTTGAPRIKTLFNAIKWRVACLPWLDAAVDDVGNVQVFRIGPAWEMGCYYFWVSCNSHHLYIRIGASVVSISPEHSSRRLVEMYSIG